MVAGRDVAAKRGRTAGADRRERALLSNRQVLAHPAKERSSLTAKYVGDFEVRAGGGGHGGTVEGSPTLGRSWIELIRRQPLAVTIRAVRQ
jgi:hypothetical protein